MAHSVSASVSGYFDAAAGLPMEPVAVEAFQAAAADGWGDPMKLTGPGRRSALLLDAARASTAEILGVRPDEVYFVSSGTHALQLAVLGMAAGRARAGNRLVFSAVEHSAVLKAIEWQANLHPNNSADAGFDPVAVPVGVDSVGRVDAAEFVHAASSAGVAVAVMQAANHEVGTRQPVAAVAAELRDRGVPLVVDATQDLVYGTAPLDAAVFAGDARLWGGPSGVGILVVRQGTRWRQPFPADEAERAHTSGPVSVPAIVAAAVALRAFQSGRDEHEKRLRTLVDRIRSQVSGLDDTIVLGDPDDRLPHIVTFSSLYVDGEALLSAFDRAGFVVSSGSSCTSDSLTPSHVLVAMGALTSGNIRVSLHPGVTDADVDRFLKVVPQVINSVREQLPLTAASQPTAIVDPPGRGPGTLVDSRGRRCPLPILDLARQWPTLALGDEITVISDDPAAATDIAAWCRMRGQAYLGASPYLPGGEHGDTPPQRAAAGAVAVAYRIRRDQ